jgi:hypothetical protein
VLFDDVLRNRHVGPGRGDQGEERQGIGEGDLQRRIVDRFHAQSLQFGLAVGDLFAIGQVEHGGNVFGERFRIEHATPGIDEVVGRQRRAVRPLEIRLEMEGVLGQIFRPFPAFGRGTDDFAGLLIDPGQGVVDIEEDGEFVEAGAGGRVHGDWLGDRQANHLLLGQGTVIRRHAHARGFRGGLGEDRRAADTEGGYPRSGGQGTERRAPGKREGETAFDQPTGFWSDGHCAPLSRLPNVY